MSALVRWAPTLAASADDLLNFGPQAARVRALLEFIPTMSDDAHRLSRAMTRYQPPNPGGGAESPMNVAAWDATVTGNRGGERTAAWKAVRSVTPFTGLHETEPVWDATKAEVVSDLLDPRTYRQLTNPLATGRAFDVLRPRSPENFLDVVRGLDERSLVRQPVDVLSARALARDPQREALMEVINAIAGNTGYADTGYDSLAELVEAARLLG